MLCRNFFNGGSLLWIGARPPILEKAHDAEHEFGHDQRCQTTLKRVVGNEAPLIDGHRVGGGQPYGGPGRH